MPKTVRSGGVERLKLKALDAEYPACGRNEGTLAPGDHGDPLKR